MVSPERRSASTVLLVAMILAPSGCSSGAAPTAVDAAGKPSRTNVVRGELGARLDAYVATLAPNRFAGTVLVARQGKILLNKGYGMAIRSDDIANAAESVIGIGSITKQFTAAGILKLEMQGKLSTEDMLPKYFDRVPEAKRGITLHQLLTHTAGLIDYTGDWDVEADFEVALRDETIQEALDAPLLSAPGEEFHYSNAGYSVLTAVIEKTSGRSYEEYLSDNVFKPAGMSATGYRLPDWDRHIVARYYVNGEDRGTFIERPYPYWNLLGNGGLLTTTGDLYRYHQALEGEAILSAAAKAKFYEPFLDNYAYGWGVEQTEHGLLIEHDGGGSFGEADAADAAILRRYVDADVVVIVLGHLATDGRSLTWRVTEEIVDRLFAAP